jgi:hypothetical protein
VGQRYLDPLADPLPAPRVKSTLAPNLPLLNSVKEYMKPAPSHIAALLDAVMTAERVYMELERLAVLADEQYPTGSDRTIEKQSRLLSRPCKRLLQKEQNSFFQASPVSKTRRNWLRTCT